MVKQLKNRYNDLNMNKRFVVGIDRAKMRLYDCEQTAQDDLMEDIVEVQYTSKEDNNKSKSKFDDFKWE
jgi:hypothetical protein